MQGGGIMRQATNAQPAEVHIPSTYFFVSGVFKRTYVEVIVDTKERDVLLTVRSKRKGERSFSIKQFMAGQDPEFPVWARKKCMSLLREYFQTQSKA